MRKYIVGFLAVSSGLLLLGAAAYAGINPLDPGLPPADAYGQTGIDNNHASSMCVDCHERNSAQHTDPTFAGSYSPTRADVNGSHYVMEAWTGGGAPHSGGGWTDDRWTGGQYVNGKYMFVAQWGGASPDADHSGTWSKWADTGAYVSVPAKSTSAPTNLTPGDYGIICESCHNIVVNTPAGGAAGPSGFTGSRKLLAWTTNNLDDTNAFLCEGCHATMKATGAGGNNDAGNFLNNQTTGRDHHVVYNDPITAALAATGRLWGRSWAWADTTAIMGNAVEPASYPTHIRATTLTTGDVDINTAANVNCTNCHRPHNAQTITGALILKSGNGTNLAGNGTTTTTDTNYGLERQFDLGAKESSATKLITNESNLCDGCHLGYAQ